MGNNKNVCVKIIVQFLLFLAGYPVLAQTSDTTYIISSTDKQYSVSPLNLSNNPFYDMIRPNQSGIRPTMLYSGNDRFFVGLNYKRFSKDWNPDTSGQKHKLYTHYSINQKAFSAGYQGIFHQAVGRWNLFINAGYDWIKWMNFYGTGNETTEDTENRDFYRVRSREALISAALQKKFGGQSSFIITPFYQRIQLVNDEERFLAKTFFSKDALHHYEPKNFGGLSAALQLQRLNDLLLPTKGVILTAGITHVRNINEPRFFTNYSTYSRIFLPFLSHFVFSVENGAATVTGEPEFYQLNSIGGNSLRGYRRERFSGETIFYNNNELQYIFNINNRRFKGKMGFLAFADQGRVWKKGEHSDDWHYGYGGGIMVVPYSKIYFSVQYGISNERKGIHFEFRRSL